jgi:cytochrome c oxidase subunit 2
LPSKRVVIALCVASLLALPAAALASNGGVGPPPSDTPSGDAIREVYWVVLGVAGVVFVLVEASLVIFIVRFRRRPSTPAETEGPQIHGNTRLEIAWTIIPAVILAGLAAFTFVKVSDVRANPTAAEKAAIERAGGGTIEVTAHQFYWQYTYPNGAISMDTLYVPVGRTTTLQIKTADVNHSWWVPALTGKMDAVAGNTNTLNFKPRSTGTYEGHCAELCGIQHAVMSTTVKVLSEDDYQAWLRDNAPGTQDQIALGKAEWGAVCAKCHNLDGSGLVGPQIAGNGTILQLQSLKNLLLSGQDLPTFDGYMPAVGAGWQDRQFEALLAYIKSNKQLSTAPTPGTGGSAGGG